MQVHGWGRYPRVEARLSQPKSASQCTLLLAEGETLTPRGLGRAYGDSALGSHVLDSRYLDHLLAFDPATGLLTCEAGVSLDTLLRVMVPKGWFPPVTPGTRWVSVGGAIAADVHGKNHHLDGSFCDQVTRLQLLLGDGTTLWASPTEHPELFHATCGGMGLTGLILAAELRLKRIPSSSIIETRIKTPDLGALLAAFADHAGASYSVAWIDCLAQGRRLGRSLLMLGEADPEGQLRLLDRPPLTIPPGLPSGLLNPTSVRLFNQGFYAKARAGRQVRRVSLESFFYPLDRLAHWNRLYGKPGFIQYQCLLPTAAGETGLRQLLEPIAASGRGSFLAVLKVLGQANANLLSFPRPGYTLALDFKLESGLFPLLDALDQRVLEQGGRLYLAKDARMSEATFKASYPHWREFEEIRARYRAIGHFASAQSKRLGLQ